MASSTRDRILDAALDMFNGQGERAITTNHIAKELGISPGNLYYYFRNKDEIILALFERLVTFLDARIALPSECRMTLNDKKQFLEAALEGMWAFRFIYRDVHGFVSRNDALNNAWRQFAGICLNRLRDIFRGLIEGGLMQATEKEVEALSFNCFMVMTSWYGLVDTIAVGDEQKVSKAISSRLIYQILMLDRGFITEAGREFFAELEARYFQPVDWGIGE
ncbi:MAG: TetR/AcrR family transcriptional regulator [Endozoicomonas sp.]